MIALKILDVKEFMAKLLIKRVFDNFLLSEAELLCGCSYVINGRRNKDWYSGEELLELSEPDYMCFSEQRPFLYQLIKGKKTPQSMKLILLLSRENVRKILERIGRGAEADSIEGLFLNIRYEKGEVKLITGSSFKVFTLDKTIEQEWDDSLKVFLRHYEIAFEEIS
ncbi:MAG: DUF5721 family protein [Acetivibrio ethanolgignens]